MTASQMRDYQERMALDSQRYLRRISEIHRSFADTPEMQEQEARRRAFDELLDMGEPEAAQMVGKSE